jgi:hypothetical protein
VFVEEDTGEIWFQGETVTDPVELAEVARHSPIGRERVDSMTGLADREHSGGPDVIPSRHEDVWDYGGAAGTGPGPSQSVLP